MILDLIVEALETVVRDGDNYRVDSDYSGFKEGIDCMILYSRHAPGGAYEGVMEAHLNDDKISLYYRGAIWRNRKDDNASFIIDLANPDCFNRIGEIIFAVTSKMQTRRGSGSFEIEPGMIKSSRKSCQQK